MSIYHKKSPTFRAEPFVILNDKLLVMHNLSEVLLLDEGLVGNSLVANYTYKIHAVGKT